MWLVWGFAQWESEQQKLLAQQGNQALERVKPDMEGSQLRRQLSLQFPYDENLHFDLDDRPELLIFVTLMIVF